MIHKTIIREGLTTAEERITTRPRCLYGLKYDTLTLSGQETGYIRRVLELAKAMPVGMPVWTEPTKLTAAVTAGTTALPVENVLPTLFTSLTDYAVIWRAFNDWEVVGLDNVGAETLTLSEPAAADWPEGTLVYPILLGFLPRGPHKHITDEHGVFSVDFVERFNGLTDQSIILNPLPEPPITYADPPEGLDDSCREEFSLTFTRLATNTIYTLEISDSPTGPWEIHVYFALLSDAEKSSHTKVLTFNNDYNGAAWFRAAKSFDGVSGPQHRLISKPVNPLASELAAPDMTVANLTELVDDGDNTVNGFSLRSMAFYYEDQFVYPLSAVEDPLMYSSLTYHRVKRKYAGKFYGTGIFGKLDYVAYEPWGTHQGYNHGVTITGPSGATNKFTRDGSNPTEDTVIIDLNGVTRNAAPYQEDFAGVLKGRSFKDGCRSPMAMVAIDVMHWQRPFLGVEYATGTITASCDLQKGTGEESSNSCNNLWGSAGAFDRHIYEMASGSVAPGGENVSKPLLQLATSGFTERLGFANFMEHISGATVANLTAVTWRRPDSYDRMPRTHNWGVVKATRILLQKQVPFSSKETVRNGVFLDALTTFDQDIFHALDEILPSTGFPPYAGFTFDDTVDNAGAGIHLSKFDIVSSFLPYSNKREEFWTEVLLSFFFTTPVPAPETEPSITPEIAAYAGDTFETYADAADATIPTYSGGNDWDGAWKIADYRPVKGWDTFESYDAGTVADTTTHVDGDVYAIFGDGEAWAAGEWRFAYGPFAAVWGDDFQSETDGEKTSFDLAGGTGFEPDAFWSFHGRVVLGLEDWGSYTDGTVTGADTGSNNIAENWRIT